MLGKFTNTNIKLLCTPCKENKKTLLWVYWGLYCEYFWYIIPKKSFGDHFFSCSNQFPKDQIRCHPTFFFSHWISCLICKYVKLWRKKWCGFKCRFMLTLKCHLFVKQLWNHRMCNVYLGLLHILKRMYNDIILP